MTGSQGPQRGRASQRDSHWSDHAIERPRDGGGRRGRGGGGGPFRGGALGIVGVVVAALLFGGDALLGGESGSGSGGGAIGELFAPIQAQLSGGDEAAGPGADFDYYVLAMSWSPEFCRDNPNADQCGAGRRFILHGLWPQYESGGFPEYCDAETSRLPSELLRRFMEPYGSFGLPAHQWRRHGSCTGLEPEAYLAAAARAFESIRTPPTLERAGDDFIADPGALERAFLDANRDLAAGGVTIVCRDGEFSEVRICLDRSLSPRACGRGVDRDCRDGRIDVFAPL